MPTRPDFEDSQMLMCIGGPLDGSLVEVADQVDLLVLPGKPGKAPVQYARSEETVTDGDSEWGVLEFEAAR